MIVVTNMYLAKLAVFLSLCYNLANGFSRFGYHRHGLNFLLKESNATAGSFDSDSIETRLIEQPLDHFDTYEKRSWNMRYFQRLDLWKPNGPVFLFLNGAKFVVEGELFKTGMMYDLAKETNGAMFIIEHRYYGESKPFKNFTTENLEFLSSRQALADNAKLIRERIKLSPLFSSSKIVVIGGSYAGNLAAWMKLMYPDLVDAAIASSAPVLAKADFFEYLETLSDVYHQHGTTGCYDNIIEFFGHFRKSFTTPEGINRLKRELHICEESDMTKIQNQQYFLYSFAMSFMYSAELGLDEIKQVCKMISSKATMSDMWNQRMVYPCLSWDFDQFIKRSKQDDGEKPSLYQACTELGQFRTSNSKNKIFYDNIDTKYFNNICTSVFGPDFDEERVNQGVQNTNEMYGGLKPNVTNVVFVNGELDPWQRLSVLEDLSSDAPAKVIPYSTHCEVLSGGKLNDHEELKEARIYVKNLIKNWIGAGELTNIH